MRRLLLPWSIALAFAGGCRAHPGDRAFRPETARSGDAAMAGAAPSVASAAEGGEGDAESGPEGGPIATVTPEEVADARAELRKAKAELASARRDFERMNELHKLGEVTSREYDQLVSDYRRVALSYERACAKVARLDAMLDGGADG